MSDIIYRLILADWAHTKNPNLPKTVTGLFSDEQLKEKNSAGYNCYFFLNVPKDYQENSDIHPSDIDTFDFVCVDMDLKEGKYKDKDEFVAKLNSFALTPTSIIDSGNGIHAYWKASDLDVMSYLRLQRRLIRYFDTDRSISKIYQLMRVPGTLNVKIEDNPKLCKSIQNTDVSYTCEQLDKSLPKISKEDEDYCINHYNMTYNANTPTDDEVNVEIPLKFQTLMKENPEVKRLFFGPVADRSAANYRLGHLLKTKQFTKEEARAVLLNCDKAIDRRGAHRYNYANNIVEKIWQFQEEVKEQKTQVVMAESVRSLLSKSPEDVGHDTRIYGHPMFDATMHGYRLGEVLGLIGGSGSGKSTLSLNFFKWFVERNPDYIHVFVTLEMPKTQLLKRWEKLAAGNTALHDLVYFLDQHDDNGINRELTLQKVKNDIFLLEKTTGKKIGCVVVDHIGCLSYEEGRTEYDKLMNACRMMKSFALETKTFLVMQSQSSREKAGPYADLEIDKDAAYGTTKFENYCDYILTTWQPLARVQHLSNHLVNAFKYCKIRELDTVNDRVKLNQVYAMIFDKSTETLRKINKDELGAIGYWNQQATAERNRDRKKAPSEIQDMDWVTTDGEATNNKKT